MVNVVQRIVNEETQFGDDAELLSASFAQFVAHATHVCHDVIECLFRFFGREYTQIGAANAQIRADVNLAYAHEHTARLCGLQAENVAEFLLYESFYTFLPCRFHGVLISGTGIKDGIACIRDAFLYVLYMLGIAGFEHHAQIA